MLDDKIQITIADFKNVKSLSELQKFWYAVLSFSAFEFYVLLNENINLYGHTKQSFTEKLHRKMSAHQFYGDHEFILVVDKENVLNPIFIICDFWVCEYWFFNKIKIRFK